MKISNVIGNWAQKIMSTKRGANARYIYARKIKAGLSKSLDQIQSEQLERLKEIITYAHNNCLWYAKKFKDCGINPGDIKDFSDIKAIPVIVKEDLRNNLDGMLSDAIDKSEMVKNVSGGTTGKPVPFYREKLSQDYKRGIDLALFRYFGWKDGQWQGWLWAAPRDLDEPETLPEKIKHHLAERIFCLDTKHLDDKAYETFIKDIYRYEPGFVSAYPSLAYDLAERIEAGRVTPARVPLLSVTAEPFYEFQRQKIEKYFARNVYNRYGSREFGTAAFECPEKNGMHIFGESVYIETIDSDMTEDNVGSIIVTDLLNHAMPLIRYRIGDFGRIENYKCNCGLESPRLFDVRGRETDIIWRPDGSGIAGFLWVPLMSRSRLTTRVQIIQKRIDELIIRIEGNPADHAEELRHLENLIVEEFGDAFKIKSEGVDEIKRASSGKYRYVVSEVKKP